MADDADPSWRDLAACRDLPSAIFYPETDSMPTKAKQICFQCPVRRPCLVEAMVRPELYGVWGGLSARERRRLRARRRVIVLREAS